MIKNFKKFNLFTIAIFILASVFFIFSHQAQAVNYNTRGWAWSENIGWISFNCANPIGGYPGGTCFPEGIDYGVNIDENSGLFSGYAWSENVGWIWFGPTSGYLTSPQNQAKLEIETACGQPVEEVNGWAQALSAGGWIKMRGITQDAKPYGVERDNINKNELTDWAWSEDFGWISFNCNNEESCGDADYKVTTFEPIYEPSVSNLSFSQDNCSNNGLHPQVTLSWTFNGCKGGDKQIKYHIQIVNEKPFGGENLIIDIEKEQEVEDGKTGLFSTLNFLETENKLEYSEKTYYWQVSVQNNDGLWSAFVEGPPFITPKHPYPEASLKCLRNENYGACNELSVSAGEKVYFKGDEIEKCGGIEGYSCGVTIANRTWGFGSSCATQDDCLSGETCSGDNVCEKIIPPGDPIINTINRIYSAGAFLKEDLKLTIKDSYGYECFTSPGISFKNSKVNFPLPIWKEVIPKD